MLEIIPKDFGPLVIFIDDLDRCSPNSIAKVMEGVNLFLAGEFKNCIFILGMDVEMVAASLEVAHSELISKLPAYSTNMPIGWRFMDKFIQLPIIIPPVIQEDSLKYAEALVSYPETIVGTPVRHFVAPGQPNVGISWHKLMERLLGWWTGPEGAKEEEEENIQYSPRDPDAMKHMQQAIYHISDLDEKFREQVSKFAVEFSNNPRDNKRFINLLRFYRFLMTRSKDGGLPSLNQAGSPSLDQVRRWIFLSLNWPQVVRWLYWGNYENREISRNSRINSNTCWVSTRPCKRVHTMKLIPTQLRFRT